MYCVPLVFYATITPARVLNRPPFIYVRRFSTPVPFVNLFRLHNIRPKDLRGISHYSLNDIDTTRLGTKTNRPSLGRQFQLAGWISGQFPSTKETIKEAMNKALSLPVSILIVFVLTFGNFTPGQAVSQAAVMPAATVNIAHFFKPPNMDPAPAAKTFNMIVLTNGDHAYRDQLAANGFASTIPEYFRADAIQNPGSCTATPVNNQVAYKPGDFCSITANHPDWFLFDTNGFRITVAAGGEYYRMDPANPGWREFFLTRVLDSQNQHGWSGLFLDNVEAGLGKFYGPKPVKYVDNASYQKAFAGFLQYLYVNYAEKYHRPLIANIVARADDTVWFTYLQYLDGAMQERFAVDWDETSYLSANQWLKDLAFFEKTQADGKSVILVAPGNQSDLKRQNFAFASYLLISNGKAAFRYSTDDEYRNVWLYDNYRLNLGSPRGGRYLSGTSWRRDFTNGYVSVDPVNHTATISVGPKNDMTVTVGGKMVGAYNVPSTDVISESYSGVVGGPVKVGSQEGNRFFTSQRVVAGTSFNEVMGYPTNQLTTEYWFPWYDNLSMTTWVLVGNPTGSTAAVDIYVGGIKRNSYSIPAGGRVTPRFDLQTGPVRVVSTNGVKIFTSERVDNKGSFNEVMGYPTNQLTTDYWFPWYDNSSMTAWVLVGNPSSTQTASVDIYIGGIKRKSYTIPKGGQITPRFNLPPSGLVRVVSTNGVKIFTSERVLQGDSFNEVMGCAGNQLTTEYWYPWYDNISMMNWILVGNPTGSTANVEIYIGGAKRGSYTIPAGGQVTPRFNLQTGPVRVVSTNGVKIFTSQRVNYGSSFNEVMGYAGNKLTTEYWFPWYDNTSMSTDILVGRP
jgi:hypothetical protein